MKNKIDLDPYTKMLTVTTNGVACEISYQKAIATPAISDTLSNATLTTICKALTRLPAKNFTF